LVWSWTGSERWLDGVGSELPSKWADRCGLIGFFKFSLVPIHGTTSLGRYIWGRIHGCRHQDFQAVKGCATCIQVPNGTRRVIDKGGILPASSSDWPRVAEHSSYAKSFISQKSKPACSRLPNEFRIRFFEFALGSL
jgi:hypothetical protein